MVFDFLLNVILVISAISLFNLIRCMLKVRKIIKMHKDNPNIQGISIVNGEVKIIEKGDLPGDVLNEEVEVPVEEKVIDPVCHTEINQKDAYRMVKDEKEYFFCSWECREQFLKGGEGNL